MKTFYSDLSCDTFLLRSVTATAACCLSSDTAVNIETSCAAAPPSLAVGRGREASFTQHKPSPYQLPARSRELTFRHYLSSLCLPSKWGLRGEGWISTDCAVIQTFRGVGSSSLASRRRLGSAPGRFTAARVVGGGVVVGVRTEDGRPQQKIKKKQMELPGETYKGSRRFGSLFLTTGRDREFNSPRLHIYEGRGGNTLK